MKKYLYYGLVASAISLYATSLVPVLGTIIALIAGLLAHTSLNIDFRKLTIDFEELLNKYHNSKEQLEKMVKAYDDKCNVIQEQDSLISILESKIEALEAEAKPKVTRKTAVRKTTVKKTK